MAAGSPCKVIKENCYPIELSNEKLEKIACNIMDDWCKLHKDKNITDVSLEYNTDKNTITLKDGKTSIYFIHFNIREKTMTGIPTEVSEDLRDYLRRRGIKIYTHEPFKSIKPKWMEN